MQATARAGLDHLARDFRLAWRALRRTPAFTIAAVSSLALGLALAAAAVALVNAYLVRSLPYPASERLYHVKYAPPGPVEPRGISVLDWSSLRDVVRDPVTASSVSYYIGEGTSARTVRGLRVAPGFLSGLGVRTVVGRSLVADDFAPSGDPVAVIGHALWRAEFGGAPDVVGRSLRMEVEGRAGAFETVRIVGVLAPGFWFGPTSDAEVDVLTPLRTPARTYVVRLRDGVSAAAAERRLTSAVREIATWIPPDWPGVEMDSMSERYVRGVRPTLVGIALAAGLVLAITCVNVAVLTLLRAMRRQRDVAVRVVLGAGRADVLRLYLLEVGLICAAALAAGVMLAMLALRLLAPLIETELGRPAPGGRGTIAVAWTVLWVLGGVSLLVALTLAAVPALLPWQRRLAQTLHSAGRAGTDSRLMRRARSALVALQLAGSLALVVACGLMVRSVVGMVRTDLGFRSEELVRVRVRLRDASYPDSLALQRFYAALADRLTARGLPAPAYASWPPFAEAPSQAVERDGRPGGGITAGVVAVGDGYFETLGIVLRQGRAFSGADRIGSEQVAMISETLARRLWPDGDAIGRRIRAVEPQQPGAIPAPWRTIVGVVADVRQTYDDRDQKDMYVPYFQGSLGRYGSFYMLSRGSAESLTRSVRAAVAEVDPYAIVRDVLTVEDENRRLASARFMTSLLTGYAAFTALLAMLGVYGVVAYSAQQRRREMAIRMAIGATGSAVVSLFLREIGRALAAGVALGVIAAVAVARVFEHQLYGLGPFDVPTLLGACVLMTAAGMLATWWPARRAATISLVAALNES